MSKEDNPVPSLDNKLNKLTKFLGDKKWWDDYKQGVYDGVKIVLQNGVETNKVQLAAEISEEWDTGIPVEEDISR